jgi:hypothetical protein
LRVHPGQTLILAGEPLPRRSAAGGANASNTQRVTIISARVDALVTDAEYTPTSSVPQTNAVAYDAAEVGDVDNDAGLPAAAPRPSSVMASRAYSAYASSSRSAAFGGASAYARTQDLSERHPIIDTYA